MRVLTDISTKVVKTPTIGPGNDDVFYDRQKGFKTNDKETGLKKKTFEVLEEIYDAFLGDEIWTL